MLVHRAPRRVISHSRKFSVDGKLQGRDELPYVPTCGDDVEEGKVRDSAVNEIPIQAFKISTVTNK